MENYHDSISHLEYFRDSLSQNNKPIGFFLSSGCPLSVNVDKEIWPLIPDVKNLTLWVNKELSSNSDYQRLLEELKKAEKSYENIEDILSFIRGLHEVSKGGNVRGFSEDILVELEKIICKMIVNKINVDLPENNTPYHNLSKWISSIDRKIPIEIFTTNYDTLMEQALEDLEIPFFDGFVGSSNPFFDLRSVYENSIPNHWTRIWKIHGSINWYKKNIRGKERVSKSNSPVSVDSHLIYPSHLKYDESRKMPYLALIDRLEYFIKQKSALLIISGYSFNDDHLNSSIISSLKSNPTAMVIALLYENYLNDDGSERYPKAYKLANDRSNLNIWTFDKAIIGTNHGNWNKHNDTDDNSLLNFIDETEDKLFNIKLGDFSVLADFLRRMIWDEIKQKYEE